MACTKHAPKYIGNVVPYVFCPSCLTSFTYVQVNTLPYCPQKFMVQRSMSPLPCALTHLKQTHVLHAKHTRLVQFCNLNFFRGNNVSLMSRELDGIHYNFRALEEEFATTFPCFHFILPSSLNCFIRSFHTCSRRQHSIMPTGKKSIPTFPLQTLYRMCTTNRQQHVHNN